MSTDSSKNGLFSLCFIILVFCALSCSAPPQPPSDLSETGILDRTVEFMATYNATKIREIENAVEEKGHRPDDVLLLNRLKDILGLGPESTLLINQPDSLNPEALGEYIDHLIMGSKEYNWQRVDNIQGLPGLIANQKEKFLSDNSHENYLLLLLSIYTLQKELIMEHLNATGIKVLDAGFAYIHDFSDTLENGKEFKAVITLGEPVDEEIMVLEDPYIRLLNNGKEVKGYDLEYTGSGAWIFTFVPGNTGNYTFTFNVESRSRLNLTGWGYPFSLDKEFVVR